MYSRPGLQFVRPKSALASVLLASDSTGELFYRTRVVKELKDQLELQYVDIEVGAGDGLACVCLKQQAAWMRERAVGGFTVPGTRLPGAWYPSKHAC